jgi:antitoxin HicB
MDLRFEFPAVIEPDEAGRFLVRFPDLPEALTDGATIEDAMNEAADCLTVALSGRLSDGLPVPVPSPVARGQYRVAPAPEIALKAALRSALTKKKATAADLARALNVDHKDARRLLDPDEPSKLPRLSEALASLGYAVSMTVYDRSSKQRLLSTPRVPRLHTPKVGSSGRVRKAG